MSYGNSFQRTTPIVLNLIIINAIVFFAQMAFGGMEPLNKVNDLFALHHYKSEMFKPHQLVTHMFMHGGLFHILFNMLALWMFGTMLERIWGPKRFLIFYLVCGLGAGLAQMGSYVYDFWQIDHMTLDADTMNQYQTALRINCTVGASGAIMGVLAAFGYLFPNTQLFIVPIPFPVKAKWAILGMIALDVFGGVSRTANDNIAHFAHVGGALIGFLIVLFWNKTNKQTFY
ncbi:MAG: rhomboid family intramembrane serine protease [Bacteroidetes bacterium]|nr:rhomboid family intramembrane serine protease [Bacteroidota bacterium]